MNGRETKLVADDRYIWIRNWDRFQHYRGRRPLWIKVYVELLNDDNYLELTERRALMLHRLWLEFAASRSRMKLERSRIAQRISFKRVTNSDIEALAHAGFIEVIDSKTLATRLQDASLEEERDKDKETPPTPPNGKTRKGKVRYRCDQCGVELNGERSLAFHIQNVHDGPAVPLSEAEVRA